MILGIAGSPRQGGNTELLLDQALAGARSAGADTEKIVLSKLQIQGCTHCEGCLETGRCVIRDDMDLLYMKFREMEALFIAAPIYFLGLPSQLKAVIDRCEAFWVLKNKLNQAVSLTGKKRPGVFISVAGAPDKTEIFNPARRIIRAFFSTIDVVYTAELFFPETELKGQIREHPTALMDAYTLGARIARSL
ncbi:MAG: flavodoxin family protein [Chloroflexi bacterium]|nr:MAG: flavodoxin family protein [Chloroflexota bacterium]HDN79929.1 flavodoxin family protein [Chloroflexota bacterium]